MRGWPGRSSPLNGATPSPLRRRAGAQAFTEISRDGTFGANDVVLEIIGLKSYCKVL
jgi:hypothetical protein